MPSTYSMNLQTINRKLQQYETFVFWAVCGLLAVLQYFFGLQHFYFDAERYWESGRELKVDGIFSLYNHVTPRGVLFPLFNYALIELLGYLNWHEISVFKCLSAVFSTWGFWFVLPSLYQKITHGILSVMQKIGLVAIGNFFWFRYFSCPLSDFLCLFLLLYGFLLLWKEQLSMHKVLMAGLICGFILNTRPIYSLLLVGYPVFMFLVSKSNRITLLLSVVLLVASAFVVNIPQHKVNQKIWQSDSFFQPTDKYYGGKSLYLIQLKWGLYIQKYDTYVGDTACYGKAPVYYLHNRLTSPVEAKTKIGNIETFGQYFHYLFSHPVGLIWFAKNLFNGIDIQYDSPYVYHLIPNPIFSLFNYLIWFLGGLLLILTWRKWFRVAGGNFIFGYLMLTTILSIPTAIEVRFLVVMYLMVYVLVVSQSWVLVERWKQWSNRNRLGVLLLAVVFVWVCFYLSQTTYSQLELGVNC
jgi:hypothetical protein